MKNENNKKTYREKAITEKCQSKWSTRWRKKKVHFHQNRMCSNTYHVINMLCHDITHRQHRNVQHLFLIRAANAATASASNNQNTRSNHRASCRVAISQPSKSTHLTRCKQFSTVITVHSRTWIYWLRCLIFCALAVLYADTRTLKHYNKFEWNRVANCCQTMYALASHRWWHPKKPM